MVEKPTNQQKTRFSVVILPILLVAIAIPVILLLLAAGSSPFSIGRGGISIISSVITICCFLIPLLLCFAPLYLLLMAAIYGINKLEQGSETQLARVQRQTKNLAEKTAAIGEAIAQKSIGISSRFAYFNRLFNAFEEKIDERNQE
ncbi:MAG: hypothetical protein CUN56_03070 [Phototrophicales bacterium]|nr:MAG: hypothetical protein CUN56_03070 [Phototrophicales bacterium]RMG72583.1 MAG: hypothetical protein D6711_12610 [Chloroflexota bacterium]